MLVTHLKGGRKWDRTDEQARLWEGGGLESLLEELLGINHIPDLVSCLRVGRDWPFTPLITQVLAAVGKPFSARVPVRSKVSGCKSALSQLPG